MRRQKAFKKIKLPSFFEGIRDIMLKKMINVLVAAILLFVVFLLAKAFLYRSDYFRLRAVETKNSFLDQRTIFSINNQLLTTYKNRNVFGIKLKNIAESLQRSYPDAKEVVVRVVLPDKLAVDLKFRRPVAMVRNGKYYAIDEEGFVLPSVDVAPLKDLPVIEGIDIRYDEKKGKKSSSMNLRLALELLKNIKEARFMAGYGVSAINASDAESLSFYLRNGVEVRIGPENFKERLDILGKMLKDPRLLIDKIKYIDLRFRDVIIGPKSA
jgi:cell division septal protein FtsQ